MQDSTLKKIIGFVVKQRCELSKLLSYFKAAELENGIISLPEIIINKELQPYILLYTSPYIENYSVQFSGGMIHLQADINAKQLGPLSIRYMFEISSFTFNNTTHKITLKYFEEIHSTGGMVHKAALKALSLRGSYLAQAMALLHVDFIDLQDGLIAIDLDKSGKLTGVPAELSLGFISSENGTLKLSYKLESSCNAGAASNSHTSTKPKAKVQGGYLKDLLNYSDRF